MSLRNFFTKQPATAGTTEPTIVVTAAPAPEPLTTAQLEKLQEAWAELAQAAEGSG